MPYSPINTAVFGNIRQSDFNKLIPIPFNKGRAQNRSGKYLGLNHFIAVINYGIIKGIF